MTRNWMVAALAAAVLLLLVPAAILAALPSIYGEVQYDGSHVGKVVVCAIPEGEDSPVQDGCDVIDGPGPFTLENLPAAKYDVCAFMDLQGDENGPPQPEEPFGCTPVDVSGGYPVDGVVVVMQDPQLAPEFVPEPGTLMLLGSGLAGLAGYASLRWRSRK